MNRRKLTAMILSVGIIACTASLHGGEEHKNITLLGGHANSKVNENQNDESGLQVAYIGEGRPTFSFAKTNDADLAKSEIKTFASPLQKKLYEYLSVEKNQAKTMETAVRLHNGDPTNTCVLFQSSALRANGVDIPKSTAYTTVFMGNLLNNGWERRTDFENLQPGDICFASIYHTFMFMGWYDKAHKIAYVMGNQAYANSANYKNRYLDGKNDDNRQYRTTSYYKYVGKPKDKPVLSAKIIGGNVRLRSGIDSGSITGTVRYGESVAILEQKGFYYKVDKNGKIGWTEAVNIKPTGVLKDFKKPDDKWESIKDKPNDKKEEVLASGVVNANGGLWLLEHAGSGRIKVMPRSSKVDILGYDGNWVRVSYNGQKGYAYKQYLTINDNSDKKDDSSDKKTETDDKNYTVAELSGRAEVTTDVYLNNIPFATFNGATALKTLHKGDTISIVGKSSNGWYKAISGGVTGFIKPAYTKSIKDEKPDTNKPVVESKIAKVISNNGLWLLGGASRSAEHYTVMPSGASLKVLGQSGDWTKVDYNGKIGWCYTTYISITSSSNDIKPLPKPLPKPEPDVKPQVQKVAKVISNNGLWLLGGASRNAEHYTVMPSGTSLKVLGQSGDWTKVDYNGKIGWCYSSYISSENSSSAESESKITSGVVNSDNGLWLLKEPKYGRIKVMPYGAKLNILAEQSGWYKVSYNGVTGWAYGQYISK